MIILMLICAQNLFNSSTNSELLSSFDQVLTCSFPGRIRSVVFDWKKKLYLKIKDLKMSDLDASDGASNESSAKPEPEDTNQKLLNNRGIPARKRKPNSLIFGMDDKISIPVKNTEKNTVKSKSKFKKSASYHVPAANVKFKATNETSEPLNTVKICYRK